METSLRRRPLITPTVVFMPQEEASSTHTIHEVELFQCPECESIFETAESLRLHVRTHSARKGPYGCLYCGMLFSCPPCLQDHLQSHVHVRVYRYQHHCCREVAFTCVDTLREHIELHTEGKCKCCDTQVAAAATNETLPSYQSLPMTSRSPNEAPCTCEQCGETFDTSRHLKKHVHQVHKNRSSRNVPERPFPCLYCRKSFVRLSGLQMHTYNYHSSETLSCCAFCERTFVQDSHYQLHAQRVHTGDKPYHCRVCGEAFQESTSLQLHCSSSHGNHSDDRVYKCGYCDKELSERHAFWMHLNFRHFEEAFWPPSLSSLAQSGEHSQEMSNGHYSSEDTIIIPDDPLQSSITSTEQPLLSARSSGSPCADVDVDTDTGDVCIELLPSPEPSIPSTSSSQLCVAQPPSLPAHGSPRVELALHTLQSLMRLLEQSSYYRERGPLSQASTGGSSGYQTAMDFREPAVNSLPLSSPLQQGISAPAVSRSSLSPGPHSHSSLSPRPLSRSSLSPRPLSRTSPAPPDPSSFITTQDNVSIEELCRLCAQPYQDPSDPLVPNGEEADNRPPTLRINWDAPLGPSQIQAYQQQQYFPGISR